MKIEKYIFIIVINSVIFFYLFGRKIIIRWKFKSKGRFLYDI